MIHRMQMDPTPAHALATRPSADAGPRAGRPGSFVPAAVLVTALLVLAGCGLSAGSGEGPAAESDAAAAPGGTASPEAGAPEQDPDLTLARELLASERGVLFGDGAAGEPEPGLLADIRADIASLDFGDDPEGHEAAHSLFGENPLLSDRNPLLSNSEREQWLAVAIKNVGRETALEHLREEARKLAEGGTDRAGWYEHVAACEKVCNQIVSGLLHSHVQRVRELPHQLVLFGSDQRQPRPESLSAIDAFLVELAASGDGARRELLLIGRASRSGAKEYNRRLSERRVASVRSELAKRGWDDTELHGFGLGYEPPQITEEIARLYGLDPALSGDARNQSVLIVAYPAEAAPPAGASPPGSPTR